MIIANQPSTCRRTLKILLVRPNDCDPTDTEARLASVGHCVTAVATGDDVARTLRSRPVNLILVEGYGVASVLELVSAVRGQSGRLSTHYTPTFVLADSSQESALRGDVDGVITYPIDSDALVSAYLAFLSASLNEVKQASESRRFCEIDAAIDRLGGDLELYRDLVVRFLEDNAGTRRTLESAQMRGDATTLRRAAHSLKGLAASVGAVSVAAVLGELEALGLAEDLAKVPAAWERFQREMATTADRLATYRHSGQTPLA